MFSSSLFSPNRATTRARNNNNNINNNNILKPYPTGRAGGSAVAVGDGGAGGNPIGIANPHAHRHPALTSLEVERSPWSFP